MQNSSRQKYDPETNDMAVNIFTQYTQKENHYTNSLISILNLSQVYNPKFFTTFLNDILQLDKNWQIDKFRVLKGMDGTWDGDISGKNCCICFETKIESITLSKEQIRRHLDKLRNQPQQLKRLVLLTPDDSNSRYIQERLSFDKNCISHLKWTRVYDFFENSIKKDPPGVFTELLRQFNILIYNTIFEHDFAGIIMKIQFGKKSGVDKEKYLDEIKAGKWRQWNTPKEYNKLDGTRRKLMLYDKIREAITVQVEIQEVIKTNLEPGFPWTNKFAPGTLHIFKQPISLECIRKIEGFENFKKGRSPFRNITHEQYRELVGKTELYRLTQN